MSTRHAELTDEAVAELRRRIGVVWRPRIPYYNEVATKDAIRHYCYGIGDANPLFIDEEYAKKTKLGTIIAPPCFLYSVYWPAEGRGLPGVHAWHSGDDWYFYKTIRMGDEITYSNTLTDVLEKPSQMAGRILIQHHDIVYSNKVTGEVIAKADDWSVRAGRQASQERGKYADIKRATYTPEDMKRIQDAYGNEEIRGANPRYWEDVNVGDSMGPIIKGPLSMRDMIAWLMGAGSPFMKAHGLAYSFYRRHPGAAMLDSQTGILDVPELVHMEDTRAQEIGIPGAYDYGCQRLSWLGNLLTNWQGDDGFVKRLRGELRRFNVIGDTQWIKGKITKKYIENGEHLVDCEVWAENQRGEITAPGIATIALTSRGK